MALLSSPFCTLANVLTTRRLQWTPSKSHLTAKHWQQTDPSSQVVEVVFSLKCHQRGANTAQGERHSALNHQVSFRREWPLNSVKSIYMWGIGDKCPKPSPTPATARPGQLLQLYLSTPRPFPSSLLVPGDILSSSS